MTGPEQALARLRRLRESLGEALADARRALDAAREGAAGEAAVKPRPDSAVRELADEPPDRWLVG